MLCPNDGATLLMTDRQGVEIDYCPTCRGVWLDRGELDKILERNRGDEGDDRDDRGRRRPPPPPPPPPPPQMTRDYDREYERYDRYDPRYRKKKKKSFLDDIFDFD